MEVLISYGPPVIQRPAPDNILLFDDDVPYVFYEQDDYLILE